MSQPLADRGAADAYDRLAGVAAIVAGIGAIVYSVAFLGGVVLGANPELGKAVSSVALTLGGILSVAVLVAIYRRLGAASPGVALLGLALALIGAVGTIAHGGYDLANVLHPPLADVLAEADVPHPVDPRGLLTFGLSGLGLAVLALEARRHRIFPGRLAWLGVLLGAMLVVVYVGRLVVYVPTNPLVAVPAALTGVILSPAFYLWLGVELRRR